MIANLFHSSSLVHFTWVDIPRDLETRAEIRVVQTRKNSDRFVDDLFIRELTVVVAVR
jgi:hypothetical protein